MTHPGQSNIDYVDIIDVSNVTLDSDFQDLRYSQVLTQDGVTFIGLKSVGWRSMLYWTLVVISCGTFFLAAKILPLLQSKIRFEKSILSDADRILVKRIDEGQAVYEIIKISGSGQLRWLEYMCYRYLWLDESHRGIYSWVKVKYSIENQSFKDLYREHRFGLDDVEADQRVHHYGKNTLDVPVPSYFKLFYTEVIHPFYIFQVMSILIWLWEDYWIYACCIFVMAVVSAIVGVWQARKNREMLADMCHSECVVRVLRRQSDGSQELVQMSSTEIAPGDLVEIRPEMNLPCDLLMIQGQCVVNESSLTGESVPVAKVSIPHHEKEIFHIDVHGAKHVLFNGTTVVQVRGGQPIKQSTGKSPIASLASSSSSVVSDGFDPSGGQDGFTAEQGAENVQVALGLAISTGFSTAKGDLIRSIMFPKPTRFKFYRDSMRFVGVLFLLSLICLAYTIIIFTYYGSPVVSMFKRGLDLITISVPPALPIAMTIATAFSIRRLKADSIFCTSPQRVNVCGTIDVMCFDKTGTLTEDHLDVYGVLPNKYVDQTELGSSISTVHCKFEKNLVQDLSTCQTELLHALASCHSLSLLHGNYLGDPLEVKMFEATGWVLSDAQEQSLTDASGNPYHGSIMRPTNGAMMIYNVKFFEFSSLLQRMSVISQEVSEGSFQLMIHCKGAPEVIKTLCNPDTLPADFDATLSRYTQQGKRVLAIARRTLRPDLEYAMSLQRSEVETGLDFLGLFILQNQLKHDTTDAILKITDGSVANIMVTGDNEYTAINVARQCGILAERETNGEGAVHLVTLKMEGDVPIGINYTYVPGIDPSAPEYHEQSINPHLSLSLSDSFESTNSDTDLVGLDGYDGPAPHIGTLSPVTSSTELTTFHNGSSHENRVFAVHGKAFEYIRANDRQLYKHILNHGRVYARMSPLDKAHLIEGLQSLGHTVGMCGDGANDVGALKAADVGLSLSDAEASVAAPFTSKYPSIQSVFTLLREGRCALASSIQCYKYMAVYSMIQLMTSVILYAIWWESRLTDPQFLWIDIFLVFPLSFLMGRTEPHPQLSKKRPPGVLVSWSVVGSVILQTVIHLLFQMGFFFFLTYYYVPQYHPSWTLHQSMYFRVGTLFVFANFEYIGSCAAFSISKPWRKSLWTNWPFAASLIALSCCNLYLVLSPAQWLMKFLSISRIEPWLQMFLLGVAVFEMVLSWLAEKVIIISVVQPWEEKRSKLVPIDDHLPIAT